MQSSQYQGSEAARLVWIIGSPIIYAIGVPGNLITILVLLRSNKKTSTSVFLTFVAIADLLVLLLLLPRWWIIYVFGLDIRLISNAFCKVHWFITYSAGCTSAAFLVAVTAERIVSITRPYKVKTWCTVNKAIITSMTIVMFQTALHGHNLYGMKLFSVTHYDFYNDGINSSIQCQEDEPVFLNGTTVTSQVFSKDIDNKTASLIPSVCTAQQSEFCVNTSKNNVLTDQENNYQNNTCKIQIRDKKEIDVCWFDDPVYGQFSMGAYQFMIIFIYNVITEGSILVGMIVIIRQLAISKRLRKRMKLDVAREKDVHSKKMTFESHSAQITRSLLLVNAIFIICGTPVQIFLAGRSVWINSETGMTKAQEIIWAVVNMLFYFNHAVNFILYFLGGSRFRKQVKETFKCNGQGKKLHEMSLSNIRSATDFGQSVTSNKKDIFNFNETQ